MVLRYVCQPVCQSATSKIIQKIVSCHIIDIRIIQLHVQYIITFNYFIQTHRWISCQCTSANIRR